MLILLFLFALFRHLQSAPLTANEGSATDLLLAPQILSRADVVFGTRSTSDIITSCLATIFACTWTAIHPNIPSPTDSRWSVFKRQIVTTVYALLVPEFITVWAFRQYLGAKKIMRDYNSEIANQIEPLRGLRRSCFQKFRVNLREWLFGSPSFHPVGKGEIQRWTTTHGFLIQMGGFVLTDNGMPIQAMSYSKAWLEKDDDISEYIAKHKGRRDPCDGIKELIMAGVIDAPKITESEIEDRSKGDAISKTIVILQTTWFIAQCIARWSTSIPVTELEILTLGFAMLNGITYVLWWHKPQNVGVPVYLEIKTTPPNSLDSKPVEPSTSKTHSDIELHQMDTEPPSNNQVTENQVTEELGRLFPKHLADTDYHKKSFLERKFREDWASSSGIELLFLIPYRLTDGFFRPFMKLVGSPYDYVHEGDLRVPMFFGEPGVVDESAYFLGVIAVSFGLVHLVPSFFLQSPLRTTILLWRISAAFITGQTLVTLLVRSMRNILVSSSQWILVPVGILFGLTFPLYIVARLALIILAFISLRDLPENTFLTIDWISSIPHL